jgi:predicted DNA-binding transcriptional regulator AlpA
MPDDEIEWLTTQETMAALGISRTRLWQLVREGRLTPYQRGANRKVRYYSRAAVDRVAAEQHPRVAHSRSETVEEDD